MTIEPSEQPGEAPTITFAPGPERETPRRDYSTAVMDPNAPGDILLFGGLLSSELQTSDPTLNPFKDPVHAISANMERYRAPTSDQPQGSWEVTPNMMGDRLEDGRQNHLALVLPSKQLLIINGGRYFHTQANYHPVLLTPSASAPGGYERARMNPGTEPRLYHNTALLLPDGRIFVASGGSFGVWDKTDEGEKFHLNVMMQPTGTPKLAEAGTQAQVKAENYQIELYYPPYLFAPGPRPMIKSAPKAIAYDQSYTMSVDHMTSTASVVLIKLGAVTHAWDMGQRLVSLDFSQDMTKGDVTFKAPSNPHMYTPGYYMMFYVNDKGKPAVAKMVQLKASS